MATIEKREGKRGSTYRVDIRIPGVPRQRKTFKRLSDAKHWAQETETRIRRGALTDVVKEKRAHTLETAIKRYREEVLVTKAVSTQRAEKQYLDWWERELGEYALTLLTAEVINRKLNELSNAGDTRFKSTTDKMRPRKPKAQKTIKNYRDCLEQVLKQAKKWSLTGSNPMEKVNRITKINNARTRFLSDEERSDLLEACQASANKMLYPIVVFALSTGARKGELLKLTLDDIDWKRDQAILRDTKNGETRAVPILGHLKQTLVDHVERVEELYDDLDLDSPRWLFPRRDGIAPIEITRAWETARDEAKIDDFRFHDLRHSAASYLAMNGATLLEIAQVLGHKTLQMVKRYSHLSEDHTRGVVSRMNEKIFTS